MVGTTGQLCLAMALSTRVNILVSLVASATFCQGGGSSFAKFAEIYFKHSIVQSNFVFYPDGLGKRCHGFMHRLCCHIQETKFRTDT